VIQSGGGRETGEEVCGGKNEKTTNYSVSGNEVSAFEMGMVSDHNCSEKTSKTA